MNMARSPAQPAERNTVGGLMLPKRAAIGRMAPLLRQQKAPIPGAFLTVSAFERGYLMNRISEYFGSGHRSSATSFSSLSAISRTAFIAGMTVSRM